MCCTPATPQLKWLLISQTAVDSVPKGLLTKRAYFFPLVGGVSKNVPIIHFFFTLRYGKLSARDWSVICQ